MSELTPCDCLNYCGDDPRVVRREVAECTRYRERRLQLAAAERQAQLQRALGIATALEGLEQLALLRGITVEVNT